MEETGPQLVVGDAKAIRQFARRRQKNDRRDAQLLLELLLRGDFPVVHVPSAASRDVLALLRYRPPAGTDAHHAAEWAAGRGAEPSVAAGAAVVHRPRPAAVGGLAAAGSLRRAAPAFAGAAGISGRAS